MKKEAPYYAKEIKSIDNGSSPEGHKYWNYLKVGVYERQEEGEDKLVGEYERNFPNLCNTFHPFQQGDKWFALYSKDYTSTRVMSLPECEDLCGEERHKFGFGFCPTGFYVPYDDEELKGAYELAKEEYPDKDFKWVPGTFGFVCGCVWGDDSSWKIQFLDLSNIKEGRLIRDNRFGYVELLGSAEKLKDAFEFHWFDYDENDERDMQIQIACATTFSIKGRLDED